MRKKAKVFSLQTKLKILKEFSRGMGSTELAKKYDITRGVVYAWRNKYQHMLDSKNNEESIIKDEIIKPIKEEPIHLSVKTTIVQDGYVAPTPDQIENGEVGDNRDMEEGGIFDFINSIPGYPSFTLWILGLVSITAIILKMRKN